MQLNVPKKCVYPVWAQGLLFFCCFLVFSSFHLAPAYELFPDAFLVLFFFFFFFPLPAGWRVFLWPCLALGVSAFFMRKNGKKRPGRPLSAESPFQAISRRSCCCCALFGATRSCSSLAAVCAYIFIFTYKSEKKPRKKGGAKKFPAPALLAFAVQVARSK